MSDPTIQELAAMNPADALRHILKASGLPLHPNYEARLATLRDYCEQPVPTPEPEPKS